MAIGYKKKKQKLAVNGRVKDVYLAKVSYGSYVDTDLLAEEVAKKCAGSEAVVLMVLRAVEESIATHLAMGDVVKLNSIGTFSPTITSKAQDSADKVNQFSIARTGIHFRPTTRLKDKVREAGVRLVDRKVYAAETHQTTKRTDR
jgi:predicted histone-like DNA-binding protein